MAVKISVVINTLNEEKNIEEAIKSVAWADEVIVCDMHSEDKSAEKARKMGAKVFLHERQEFVELARNFATSKASGDWILVLDPDERIPETLAKRLQEIASNMNQIDYVRLPRRNLIFGYSMKASMWWPDYNIRFFKKGSVKWGNQIHRPPQTSGEGLDLPAEESYAIIHLSYGSISEFLKRMDRYTSAQANELRKGGYEFSWKDLLEKPLSEFLSRFFAGSGHKDGLHGLVLGLLQAFSFLIVYLKLWEMSGFKQQNITLAEIEEQKNKTNETLNYWIKKSKMPGNFLGKIFKRVKN